MFDMLKGLLTGPKCGDVYRGKSENFVLFLGMRQESIMSPQEVLIWSRDKGSRWVHKDEFHKKHQKVFHKDPEEKVHIDLKLDSVNLSQEQFDKLNRLDAKKLGKKQPDPRPWKQLEEYFELWNVKLKFGKVLDELKKDSGRFNFHKHMEIDGRGRLKQY